MRTHYFGNVITANWNVIRDALSSSKIVRNYIKNFIPRATFATTWFPSRYSRVRPACSHGARGGTWCGTLKVRGTPATQPWFAIVSSKVSRDIDERTRRAEHCIAVSGKKLHSAKSNRFRIAPVLATVPESFIFSIWSRSLNEAKHNSRRDSCLVAGEATCALTRSGFHRRRPVCVARFFCPATQRQKLLTSWLFFRSTARTHYHVV